MSYLTDEKCSHRQARRQVGTYWATDRVEPGNAGLHGLLMEMTMVRVRAAGSSHPPCVAFAVRGRLE